MKLTYFEENNPFAITEFPFDDMYITDAKFIKIAINNTQWLGILTGNYTSYIGDIVLSDVNTLAGFINIQTKQNVTKAEIINRIYDYDQQIKLLRDKEAGRNLDKFIEFDEFVQSIP